MASLAAYELLAIGVVLVALVMLLGFHFLHDLRMRRLKAMRGDAASPQTASDRAYNRLALARREADLLEAQGGDVEPARELITLANRQLEGRAYGQAYDLAQAAHETLVKGRRGPLRSGPPAAETALPSSARVAASGPTSSTAVGGSTASPAGAGVPKNRAEAQFQLRLFEEELARASKAGTAPSDAKELFVQAHAAYDRTDYAEAFRLSLRGRRRVGASIESLGPSHPASSEAEDGRSVDAARTAEQVAAQDRCPSCGHPTVPGDVFCRGCGAARTPTTCPKCGAARTPADSFCGTCGERYAPLAATT